MYFVLKQKKLSLLRNLSFRKCQQTNFWAKNELSGQNQIFSPPNLGKGMIKHVVLSILQAKWPLERAISQISKFFNCIFTFCDFFFQSEEVLFFRKSLKNTVQGKIPPLPPPRSSTKGLRYLHIRRFLTYPFFYLQLRLLSLNFQQTITTSNKEINCTFRIRCQVMPINIIYVNCQNLFKSNQCC